MCEHQSEWCHSGRAPTLSVCGTRGRRGPLAEAGLSHSVPARGGRAPAAAAAARAGRGQCTQAGNGPRYRARGAGLTGLRRGP
eukprot:452848-Hanusia_phi.AAC.1